MKPIGNPNRGYWFSIGWLTDWAIWPVSSWLPHKRRPCFRSLNKCKMERTGAVNPNLKFSTDLMNLGNLLPKKHLAELPRFILVSWDTTTQLGKKGCWRSRRVVVCRLRRKLILHLTVLLLKGSFRQILSHVTANDVFWGRLYEIVNYCPPRETKRRFLTTSHTKGFCSSNQSLCFCNEWRRNYLNASYFGIPVGILFRFFFFFFLFFWRDEVPLQKENQFMWKNPWISEKKLWIGYQTILTLKVRLVNCWFFFLRY